MIELFLRTYVECTDKSIAEKFADQMVSCLGSFCYLSIFKISKYWKVNDFFEVSFDVKIKEQNKIHYLLDLLGNGWHEVCLGREYLWEPDSSSNFMFDIVRWAHLERMD